MVQAGIHTSIGLVGYLILVIVIGRWASKIIETEMDFFLGGEKLPGWALALSERSSGMSGWLLLGVPGLAWAIGVSAVWVLVGTTFGAIFQWIVYARPFMEGRKETGAITPIGLLAEKLPSDAPIIRVLPAIVTFIFYMGYVGAQFLAGGKILEKVFGIDPFLGLLAIAVLVTAYSLAGGFPAVVWTDAMQALLMLITLVVLPGYLLINLFLDPTTSLMGGLAASGGHRTSLFGGREGAAALIFVGAGLSWLFQYLGGYPHLNARMMAIRDDSDRQTAIVVASVWGLLTSSGALLLGLLARVLNGAPQTIQADREMVLPYMVLTHAPDLLGGVLLAGALAAMMSTADSQIVVASSSAAQDIYNKVLTKNREFSEKVELRISRIATLAVGAVGLLTAVLTSNLVYTLVSYAGTGLFSAFGPAFTLLFFRERYFSKAGLIAAFVAGPAATILWVSLGFSSIITVRLIAPPIGFIAAIGASLLWPRTSQSGLASSQPPAQEE
ncbi:sodium/proline symporter [Halobacterium sp. KA-6]|uniref:sodium/proline symporter n=1 Tax=Halobacterium sp. KA-6 TaxID=2896368 RepID=UPI001E2DA267|nr:sodium/proline symporter [Halobacterium sp. KA-6]MCD2205120.1 sodium/proline symporter [Halobacterium sp. KA-6]